MTNGSLQTLYFDFTMTLLKMNHSSLSEHPFTLQTNTIIFSWSFFFYATIYTCNSLGSATFSIPDVIIPFIKRRSSFTFFLQFSFQLLLIRLFREQNPISSSLMHDNKITTITNSWFYSLPTSDCVYVCVYVRRRKELHKVAFQQPTSSFLHTKPFVLYLACKSRHINF